MLPILLQSPVLFVLLAVILVLTLSVHECAHAFVADKLGDPTAKYAGRLTLNPAAHLDLFGTIFILIAGIGWGKPVPVNSAHFKNPRGGSALVAFAGPLSNMLLAAFFSLLIHLLHLSSAVNAFLYVACAFSLRLGFFNLLPVFPLDGFNVVYGVLPLNLAWQWQEVSRYGIYILLILIVTGTTGFFINAPADFMLKLLGL